METLITINTSWDALKAIALDDLAAARPFSARLTEENGWTSGFTARAMEEYRKFLFLGATCSHPVTPSDVVDQVWHLHLLYTRSYWLELCEQTLGHPFHHGPSKGGTQEDAKYGDSYRRTLDSYRNFFGPAPADIWPIGPQPKKNHQRVDRIALESDIRRKSLLILALGFLSGVTVSAALYLWLHS